MSKDDFAECYWCYNRRATIVVTEPFVFDKKINMCDECFKIRQQIFPFEKLDYEEIRYSQDG